MQYLKTYEGIFKGIKNRISKYLEIFTEEEKSILQGVEDKRGYNYVDVYFETKSKDNALSAIVLKSSIDVVFISINTRYSRISHKFQISKKNEFFIIKGSFLPIDTSNNYRFDDYQIVYKSDSINDVVDFLEKEKIKYKIFHSVCVDLQYISNFSSLANNIMNMIDEYGVISKGCIDKYRLKEMVTELVDTLPTEKKRSQIRGENWPTWKVDYYTFPDIHIGTQHKIQISVDGDSVDRVYEMAISKLENLNIKFIN